MGHGVISDTDLLVLADSKSLASDFVSAPQETQGHDMGSMQIVWSEADTTDGIFIPQVSNDKVNWSNFIEDYQATPICADLGSMFYDFPDITFRWWRIAFIANTTTTGSCTITGFLKRRR